ncbi:MAG: response regulator [Syntrophaceae bacterium]
MKRHKILAVDDTEMILDGVVETFGDEYEVIAVTDGASALRAVKKSPPDLILLDIVMPGMDGHEVLRRLKADEATRSIPVIFLTSLDDEKDEVKGLQMGAADYITKPLNPAVVRARVRNYIELKDHQDRLEAMVAERTAGLVEANAALKALLRQRDQDKEEAEEAMAANLKFMVLPHLQKLKATALVDRQKALVLLIDENLKKVASPFIKKLYSRCTLLTSRELQVADYIRSGKTSKEIAEAMTISSRTVDIVRYSIRKKLGINNEKANLQAVLLSI